MADFDYKKWRSFNATIGTVHSNGVQDAPEFRGYATTVPCVAGDEETIELEVI